MTKASPSARLQELRRLYTDGASIESTMPLKHTNGFEWTSMRGDCSQCGCTLPGANLRGLVTAPTPGIFVIDAVGLCEPCLLLTPFHWRLSADGSFSGIHGDKWRSFEMQPVRPVRWRAAATTLLAAGCRFLDTVAAARDALVRRRSR